MLIHFPLFHLQIVAALCIGSCLGSWAPPAVSYQSQVLHAPWAYSAYAAPVHYVAPAYHHIAPVVIGHNGVPVDTPEVQAARAAHLAAHTAITGVPHDTPEVAAAKAEHFAAHARLGHSIHKRSAYNHWYAPAPVIHNGVPLDTPEVQAARAAHFAAYNRAAAGQPVYAPVYSHAPLGPDGRVVDTAEVAHAKAVHFAAVAKAQGYHHHSGAPADTPEVAHAKAAHFAAVAEAKARAGAWDDGQWDGRYAYAHNWYGQHIPVIANGVPVETAEVQHAKAAHFQAHAEANARGHHHW